MKSFSALYCAVFQRLGLPLKARDQIPARQLTAAEKKHGIKVPRALRDYYLVAGRERVLNHVFNRLVAPDEWEVHRRKLVFMVENQEVVVWGVSLSGRSTEDPAVFQAATVSDGLADWYQEQRRCSVFLTVMLHWQASFGGGLACTASAPAPPDLATALERDWKFAGEVNKMRAYGRDGQAVCVLEWRDIVRGPGLRAFAGATTKAGLETIANDLKLKWD